MEECSVDGGRTIIGLGKELINEWVGVNRIRTPGRFYEINLFFLSPPLSNQDNNKQEAAAPTGE